MVTTRSSARKATRRRAARKSSADEAELASVSESSPKHDIHTLTTEPLWKKRPRKPRMKLVHELSLADLITLGNVICGACSIFLCLNYLENALEKYLLWAFALLPLALVFDIADGSVARWRNACSPYGADLDSLADMVSFGVAPQVLGFTLGLRGFWDSVLLCFGVACGCMRLARFNATSDAMSAGTGKVKYYEGAPIPFNLLTVVALGVAYYCDAVGNDFWGGKHLMPNLGGHFHPFSLIYVFTGCAMISSVQIPKP